MAPRSVGRRILSGVPDARWKELHGNRLRRELQIGACLIARGHRALLPWQYHATKTVWPLFGPGRADPRVPVLFRVSMPRLRNEQQICQDLATCWGAVLPGPLASDRAPRRGSRHHPGRPDGALRRRASRSVSHRVGLCDGGRLYDGGCATRTTSARSPPESPRAPRKTADQEAEPREEHPPEDDEFPSCATPGKPLPHSSLDSAITAGHTRPR